MIEVCPERCLPAQCPSRARFVRGPGRSRAARQERALPVLKRALSVTLQLILLLTVFLLGSLLPALGKLPMWRVALGPTRFFVLDGLVLMLLVYLIFVGIEVFARRIRYGALLSTLALLLALVFGLAMKFPFMGG